MYFSSYWPSTVLTVTLWETIFHHIRSYICVTSGSSPTQMRSIYIQIDNIHLVLTSVLVVEKTGFGISQAWVQNPTPLQIGCMPLGHCISQSISFLIYKMGIIITTL